jgi:hypothetical protein
MDLSFYYSLSGQGIRYWLIRISTITLRTVPRSKVCIKVLDQNTLSIYISYEKVYSLVARGKGRNKDRGRCLKTCYENFSIFIY